MSLGTRGLGALLAVVVAAGACGNKEDAPNQSAPTQPAAEAPIDVALAAIVATAADTAGDVEVRRKGDAHWSPVTVGATFRAGDWIRTKTGGHVRIRVLGGGEISLDPESTMIVDTSAVQPAKPGGQPEAGATVVTIQKGTARAVVLADTEEAAKPMVIRNPDGSEAGIVRRGEGAVEFRLTSGEGGTEVAVTGGELAVISPAGESPMVAGQAADVVGGRVRKVVRMIGFPASKSPGIDARFQFEEDMSIRVSWKKVRRARGYQVQIGTDLSFRELVHADLTDARSYSFRPSGPGGFAWRVAAVDAGGRFGEYGFSRRIFVETEPPTDLLLGPKNGTKLAYDDTPPTIVFSWQSAGDARSYRVVVGTTSDPQRDSVFEQTTSAQSLTVTTLEAGNYYWGVYERGATSEPLFLEPRTIVIQKRNAPKANTDDLWDD